MFTVYLWSNTSSVYLSQDRASSMECSWECVQNVANAELASSIRSCGNMDPLMFSCFAAVWEFERSIITLRIHTVSVRVCSSQHFKQKSHFD